MNILIDTHILLWALFEPHKLDQNTRRALEEKNNEILVSTISLWEISLKYSLGKLELKGVVPEDLPLFIEKSGFDMIVLNEQEASSFHRLPRMEHHDPFDRMLIWQAIERKLFFMSSDKRFQEYQRLGLQIFT